MTENKRFTFDGRDCFDNGEFWLDLSLPTYSNVKEICKMLNELHDENIELHIQLDFLKDENKHMKSVLRKNRELEERNNRQYEQLSQLYDLIEKQDWESLTGIIQELEEAEEQLQKEWGTYGDVE